MSPQDTEAIRLGVESEHTTIGRRIRHNSEILPNHPAIVGSGFQPLTYGDLRIAIDRIGTDLRAAGFGANARILIALPNGPHAALATVAIACSCVAVPLDPKLTDEEIDNRLGILRPDAILLWQGAGTAARRAVARLALRVIEAIPASDGLLGLSLAASRVTAAAPEEEPQPDAVAFILQTSGTSSEPGLIPFRHRNMLAAAARMAAWFSLTPRDRCLSVSPFYYSHGLKVTVFTPLLTGGTVAFPSDAGKFDFSEWFTALAPTWYSASPTLHRLVFDRTGSVQDAKARHSLRFILSGGAPLPRDLHEGLENALGVPVVEHYGSSEAAQIAANVPRPGGSKPGTCGIPWPDTVIVAGEDGQTLAAGTQGEILVRGATVISGYVDAPDLNRASFVGGYFKTGDIGSIDSQGFLTLHGRRKEMINRGGEKIWPAEIDGVLMTHPAVAEAAAFAVAHSRLGEDVAVAVEPRKGMTATPTELRVWLSERLASYKVPRRVFLVEQLPRGLTGKVLRRRLTETYGQAPVNQTAALEVIDQNSFSHQLKNLWERLLHVDSITVDDDFFDRGGDSLLAAELLGEIERLAGIRLPSSIFFEATTIRRIVQKLSAEDGLEAKPVFRMPSDGLRRPLIYFHGDPGGGSYVRKLAGLIGPDYPLFVVAPHGLDNEPVPGSIEAMASHRLASILRAQPEGPYRLSGYCVGGLVAFEVARLLMSEGQKVEMVVMIDPPTTNARPAVQTLLSILNRIPAAEGSVAELSLARIWYFVAKVDARIGRFLELPGIERCNRVARKSVGFLRGLVGRLYRTRLIRENENTNAAGDGVSATMPFGHMPFSFFFWRYSVALSRYIPNPLAVKVLYLSAEYSAEPWRRISSDLDEIKLSGGHYSVPMDPSDLARCLRSRFQEQLT